MAWHRSLLRRIGVWSAAKAIRAWHASVRIHTDAEDPSLDPRRGARGNIYCVWHEDLLALGALFANTGSHALISRSRDGDLIAGVMDQLGIHPIRGSSSRGGAAAIRDVMRLGARANLCITVDGPRGPRRQMQPGAVYLASRTGMPLVAVGLDYDRPWRASSWDRMALARPFSRAVISGSAAVRVPPELDDDALATCRQQMETILRETSQRAERTLKTWVTSGIRPAAGVDGSTQRREERRAA